MNKNKLKLIFSKALYIKIKNKFIPTKANITKPFLEADRKVTNKKTLILVVPSNFNQEAMKASTLIPLGFAKGWAEVCGDVKIVEDIDMIKELDKHDSPAIYLTNYNLKKISHSDCKKLSKHRAFIGVNVHPNKIQEFKEKFLLEKGEKDTIIWQNNYKKVLAAEPKFVWNSAGESGMHWYQGWIEDGLKWVTLHPAADPDYYFPEKPIEKYKNNKIAYVGGYWKEKAQSFDKYLRPWEDIFVPYGYSQWPYRNYGGRLDVNEERLLYSSAGLIPLITSPGGWLISEITERYFKAPACKAFCIADENPALKEVFTDQEILQAQNAEHFNFLVNEYMQGNIDTDSWREKTFAAVISRHLYKHRALQVKSILY
jgi:hypothetical protein